MVRTLVAAVAGWLWLAVSIAGAADAAYPQHAIRMIVGFPPGGSSDAMARIVQPGLEKLLGQPIVIENKPGAGAMIAIDMIAKASPDGYTIGVGGAGALGTNLGLQEKMPYDPVKDVVPVTGLAGSPFILAASPALKGKSLRDIIALAKQQDGAISIGHGGNGTLMHLTSEMLNMRAGIQLSLVPYRGMAPVMNDLIGGHVALGIVDPPSALAAIDAGKVEAIAVTSATRFARLPEVPTFIEAGLPNFESSGWFGIVAPAGTPKEVIATLNKAFVTVLRDPAVVERIRNLGSEPMPMTPDAFSAFIRSEIDKWLKVMAASTAKPN